MNVRRARPHNAVPPLHDERRTLKPTALRGSVPARSLSFYLLGLAGLLGIGLFNFLVDPYLFFDAPRIEGFNRWKTAFFWNHLDSKSELVENSGTSMLILGTSTAGGALDPAHPALRREKVFNYAVAGSTPGVQWVALRHAAKSNPLEAVLVCVDLFVYNENARNAILEARAERFAPALSAREHWSRWRRSLETRLVNLFAYDTLEDAIATVRAQGTVFADDMPPDIRSDGLWRTARDASRKQSGIFRAIERQYLTTGWFPDPARRFELATGPDGGKLNDLRRILADARAAGLAVTIAIMPSHARFVEAMHAAGLQEEFDELKRQLVLLAGDPALAGSGIRVWDFSGYNSVTMDAVEAANEPTPWFHDSVHPSLATGNLMLYRMFAPDAARTLVPPDFGRELDAGSLEAQLAASRAQREHYARTHRPDIEDVRRIVEQTRAWRDPARTEMR